MDAEINLSKKYLHFVQITPGQVLAIGGSLNCALLEQCHALCNALGTKTAFWVGQSFRIVAGLIPPSIQNNIYIYIYNIQRKKSSIYENAFGKQPNNGFIFSKLQFVHFIIQCLGVKSISDIQKFPYDRNGSVDGVKFIKITLNKEQPVEVSKLNQLL